MEFVHLHLHSQYSLLDGAITAQGLVDRAKELGMSSVAITDHGNLHGTLEFYLTAKKAGIKPILGVEAYLTQGHRKEKSTQHPLNHITLLAKDKGGLENLFRLITLANLEGFYYKPRIDREILREYHEGILALSGCLSGVPSRFLRDGQPESAEKSAKEFQEIFGEGNYYLELMDHGLPDQHRVNEGLIELSEKLSIPVVATNDSHYLRKEDARAHDALLCIGLGASIQDQDRMKYSGEQYYVKSAEEMEELFSHYPEALKNTLEVAEKCNVELETGKYYMPDFSPPEGKTLDEHLVEFAHQGLKERLPQIFAFYERAGQSKEGIQEKYESRLEKELKTIKEMGFSGYFLIVSDFINFAKAQKIPVGPGRGSAAGSLVAYSTRITDVDPIPYNLLFERFLNPERISMPDIDVDFCQDRRDEVIKYVAEKYNGDADVFDRRVAQITTFGKMQARAVLRDVGRVLGMPYGEVDRIAKLVPSILNITLEEAFKKEEKFDELRKKDAKVDELLTIALRLEGLTRHASVHAAGVVISDNRPLAQHVPLYKGQHDEVVTQWDMKGVEKVGLIKFDFLGLKTLTLLDRAVKLVERTHGEKIDLLTVDMNDPKVFELLSRADTQGVFQLESSGMRDLVAKLKPSQFEDIVALVALYRPGPLGSGMVDDFINRKHGRTPIVYDLPELEPILKDTYGVILYQEQVMQIASALASYSLGEADLLRRAMGKKIAEEMDKQEQRFLSGCETNKFPKAKAKKIFDLMAKFAGYGFNKSHSAAYAMISFQTAYMKAHYPVEFMAACLSIDRANTDRVVLLLNDCRAQGIEVLPPDVNESHHDFSVIKGKIRFGLGAVKNVGDGAIEVIIAAREKSGPFEDLFDFCERIDLRKVNKRVIESLIKCGAFDSTGGMRAKMMASLEMAMEAAHQAQKDRLVGQENLFGEQSGVVVSKLEYREAPEWEETERLRYEKDSVGFYITGHPLLRYTDVLKRYANSDAGSLKELRDQSTARVGGMISSVKEINTRKGDRMAFATLEDLSGSVELVVFAEPFRLYGELIKGDAPIFVTGKLDIGEDQAKILVSNVAELEKAHELFSGKVHISVDATLLNPTNLQELKELFGRYKGECPTILHFRIPGKSETVIALSRDFFVAPTNEMVQDLNTLLGPQTKIHFA